MFRRNYAEELECVVNRELAEHELHLSVEEQIGTGTWETFEKEIRTHKLYE